MTLSFPEWTSLSVFKAPCDKIHFLSLYFVWVKMKTLKLCDTRISPGSPFQHQVFEEYTYLPKILFALISYGTWSGTGGGAWAYHRVRPSAPSMGFSKCLSRTCMKPAFTDNVHAPYHLSSPKDWIKKAREIKRNMLSAPGKPTVPPGGKANK